VHTPCYYLLVTVDADRSFVSAPSAHEVALHRLSLSRWGLRERTPYRRSIKVGDRVLIYIAGKRLHGGNVIASARVGCAAQPMRPRLAVVIDSPTETRGVVTDFYIELEGTKLFTRPVELRKFQSRLSFVTKPNTPKWGTRLQSGCIQLTGADYEMLRHGSEPPSRKSLE
jgi:hypothetical protein